MVNLIAAAEHSAGKLVNLLAHHFISFNDSTKFERRTVRIMKRPQILVADIWAAFNGEIYGEFNDIDAITMFAGNNLVHILRKAKLPLIIMTDYRVPQILHSLKCLSYAPPLDAAIRTQQLLPSGSSWEVQLRGCSIWCVELIKREILRLQPEAKVNAILIDFFLYDLAKEREKQGVEAIPHHRCRSIWY